MSDKNDVPGVIAPPPLIVLFFLIAGLLLDVWWPALALLPRLDPVHGWFAGGCLLLQAVVVVALSVGGFRRKGTPVPTNKPVSALVTSGIHGLSRNPIYLGMIFFLTGTALLLNSWGLLLLVPLFTVVMRYGVIAREEAYLSRKFGADYHDYAMRVPRWL